MNRIGERPLPLACALGNTLSRVCPPLHVSFCLDLPRPALSSPVVPARRLGQPEGYVDSGARPRKPGRHARGGGGRALEEPQGKPRRWSE